MAEQTNGIDGSPTGNIYINSLIFGDCGWTNVSVGAPIYYAFGTGFVSEDRSTLDWGPVYWWGVDDSFTGFDWYSSEKAAFQTALANYASVCNLQFDEAATQGSADMVWWLVPGYYEDDPGYGLLGMHEIPDEENPSIYGYFNADDSSWNNLNVGSYGYVTIIHELGHAMGLAHPHDGGNDGEIFPGVVDDGTGWYTTGDYGLNQGIWTTMSYNDGWEGHISSTDSYGWQGTLMALDIAALQELYGANMNTATGDNTYVLPKANATGTYWSCIWDAGGTDTISNATSTKACTIDLREAPLTGEHAGGYVSWDVGIYGGFTIANGVTIEKAIGGSSNDTLIGNEADNTLTGGSGNDTLDGGEGADTMFGGSGNDVYVVDDSDDVTTELSGQGTDTVRATVDWSLDDNVENLTLSGSDDLEGTGNALNNILTGNAGSNMLYGGVGNDSMMGGDDDDWLYGQEGNDTLTGGNGDDNLDGGTGNDSLTGGLGNDSYFVDSTSDKVTELSGQGVDYLYTTLSSYTLGSNVEWMIYTGSGNFTGYGNAVDGNFLIGGNGNDTLNGMAGVDIYEGGEGNDTYVLDSASELGNITELNNEGSDTIQIGYKNASTTDAVTITLNGALSEVENVSFTTAGTGLFNVTGNSEDNTLTGNASVNVLTGSGGDDTLDGGAGNDTLNGGDGDDTYGWGIGDTIIDSSGNDTVMVGATATLASFAGIENLTLTGTSSYSGTGTDDENTITGNTGANKLYGLGGDDVLNGGAGDDTLDGGLGEDEMIGGLGNDTYYVDDGNDVVTEGLGSGTDVVYASVEFELSDNVENLTLTGSGHIDGEGNGLNNVIVGNTGDNDLYGAGGNDTLTGGDGDDYLDGGTGNDSMTGGNGDDYYVVDSLTDKVTESSVTGGADTVEASVSWTLGNNVEDLGLSGSANINGTGNTLANILTGNNGDNVLDGKAGIDTYAGGNGDDTYVLDNEAELANIDDSSGNDMIQITYANNNVPTSTPEQITLSGLLADIENVTIAGKGLFNVTGNSEDNILIGNASINVLNGGDGDDTYGWSTGDTIIDSSGNDTVMVGATATLALFAGIENLTLTGTSSYSGTGTDDENTITGNTGANKLYGLGDDDVLDGGAGNDTLDGGTGDDAMYGGLGNDNYIVDSTDDDVVEGASAGTDTVMSSASFELGDNVENLTLTGSANIDGEGNGLNNVMLGNAGDNELYGLGGNDTLKGGEGNDTLDGGTGNDSLEGGNGNDTYFVDSLTDKVTESSSATGGTDTVKASVSWTLGSYVENLQLLDLGGVINGTGNTLANSLFGSDNANTLNGKAGNDTLSGDGGADTFVFDTTLSATTNVDTITDFVSGVDQITLDRSIFTKLVAGTELTDTNVYIVGSGTQGATDYIVYNAGNLYYDADGSGAGTGVLFATLTGAPTLLAGDIHVIA